MKTFSQFMSEGVSADGGLYTFRKPSLHSIEVLNEWMLENRIPNPLPPSELHASVVCSESPVPGYIPDMNPVWINPATYKVDILGEALVLRFKSDILTRKWEEANRMGAHSRWPSYQPHLSLSYAVPVDFDYSNIKPLPVQIILDEEQGRKMVDGWASVNDLREYTSQPTGGGPAIYPGSTTVDSGKLNAAPQITDIPEFVTWVERQGIEVNYIKIAVATLKPTQDLVNTGKPLQNKDLIQPIIVSSDNYILDGNHRWRTLLNRDPHYKVDTYQVDLPIQQLLALANGFPKTTYR